MIQPTSPGRSGLKVNSPSAASRSLSAVRMSRIASMRRLRPPRVDRLEQGVDLGPGGGLGCGEDFAARRRSARAAYACDGRD